MLVLEPESTSDLDLDFGSDFFWEPLNISALYEEYLSLPDSDNPKAISLAIIDATFSAAIDAGDCGILVNSSTGKDSTLMTALVLEVMEKRKTKGTPLVQVLVGISDTRSEFPEVAARMRSESEAINAYALRNDLPIECVIVGPKAEKSILVEIIGNGLALPQLKNSTASMVGASWCMDRVKKTPLQQVVELAKSRFPRFIQMIGTRSGESVRRSKTIKRYANAMPFGLTRLGDLSNVTGCIPIVHWTDNDLKQWMVNDLVPYDFSSADNLRAIYSKGSKSSELAGECSIVVTKEGGVSNVCSDLSGARFGCWMCVLSTNKSLKNTSRRDSRYVWLRKFHNYLFLHHKRGDARRRTRNKAGFTAYSLFPKGFLLEERAWMLMLLFRAEAESGFTLLDAEQLDAIQTAWDRHGFPDLSVEAIRESATKWARTGKPRLPWADAGDPYLDEMMASFASGIAGQQTEENSRRCSTLNLVAAFGASNPLYPQVKAWVFVDPMDSQRQTVMIADSINVLGGKTNGLIMGNWCFIGHREPLRWERDLADGRAFFYTITKESIQQRFDSGKSPVDDPVLQSIYENRRLRQLGVTAYDCPLASGLLQAREAAQCRFSPSEFDALYQLVTQAVILSEHIEIVESSARHQFNVAAGNSGLSDYGKIEKHGAKIDPATLKAGAKLRRLLAPILSNLGDHYREMRAYMLNIGRFLQSAQANCAVITRMAYIVRTSIYDESDAETMLATLRGLTVK